MRGRLNLFQAAMLRWRQIHPYNAVHVLAIDGVCDVERLRSTIGATLAARGLTGLTLDRRRRRYEYQGGPPEVELERVNTNGDANEAVRAAIELRLNRPFPSDGAIMPFRFFFLEDPPRFRLGLAYDHFAAGGDAIVALLADIVARYEDREPAGPVPVLYPPTFAPLMRREAGAFVRGVPWLAQVVKSCRRGVRPRYRDDADGHNSFIALRIDKAALARLLAQARRWGVTFNDILLALLFDALATQLPTRPRARRRNEIAVASIVNLRGEAGFDTRTTFGQFLSSMRLSHPVPAGVTLESLARDVHRETVRVKVRKLYLQNLFTVAVNAMVWHFLNAKQRRRLYAKAYPVLAGLSTLNVDAIWRGTDGGPPPRDYLRAVPTGPVAPLVVAATTSGNVLQLGLSYRRSSAFAPDIDRIADALARGIQSIK